MWLRPSIRHGEGLRLDSFIGRLRERHPQIPAFKPGGPLNRATARAQIFFKPEDDAAFATVLGKARKRFDMRILSYCLMLNHWHLELWPQQDGDLSRLWVGCL
jgi:hypothetical protein